MARGLKIADLAFLGRVGNQNSPLSLAGLQGFYRADAFDSAVTPDGDTVGDSGDEWKDLSGNGRDLLTTGATMPTLEYSELNGKPVVKWDGIPGAEQLRYATGFTFAGDFTIMFILRVNTATDALWMANSSINQHIRRYRGGSANNNASFFAGGSEIISSTFGTALGSACLITLRRSGTSVTWRENKTSRGSGVDGNSFTFHTFGNEFYSPSVGLGDLAEMAFYNQHHSDSSVDTLYDTWFKPRWGLP